MKSLLTLVLLCCASIAQAQVVPVFTRVVNDVKASPITQDATNEFSATLNGQSRKLLMAAPYMGYFDFYFNGKVGQNADLTYHYAFYGPTPELIAVVHRVPTASAFTWSIVQDQRTGIVTEDEAGKYSILINEISFKVAFTGPTISSGPAAFAAAAVSGDPITFKGFAARRGSVYWVVVESL